MDTADIPIIVAIRVVVVIAFRCADVYIRVSLHARVCVCVCGRGWCGMVVTYELDDCVRV